MDNTLLPEIKIFGDAATGFGWLARDAQGRVTGFGWSEPGPIPRGEDGRVLGAEHRVPASAEKALRDAQRSLAAGRGD